MGGVTHLECSPDLGARDNALPVEHEPHAVVVATEQERHAEHQHEPDGARENPTENPAEE